MNRRRYDDKFRANAVVMLQAAGWPEQKGALTQVAKHLGMTDEGRSLSRWAKGENNPPPDDLVDEKRVELSGMFETEMAAIFKEMRVKREDASYRDLGIVLGIITDKRQLLNDEPTENIKQAIHFQRTGVSTLPEHLAPGAAASIAGAQEV